MEAKSSDAPAAETGRENGVTRRGFVSGMLAAMPCAAAGKLLGVQDQKLALHGEPGSGQSQGGFDLWAMGCSHVGTDLKAGGRESLAEAIRQSERGGEDGGPPFRWDVALHLGDLSGTQWAPDDDEGREVVRQFGAARQHSREHFYNLAGNHDASGGSRGRQWWFRKWVDPAGRNTARSGVNPSRRPYRLDGTWERYSFRAGNILFLVMSDRNDRPPPVGRGDRRGGYPAGAVTRETFEWWKEMVEGNRESIIISAHHHMLRETTVASGPWEGFKRKDGGWASDYHGYFSRGAPRGASYLHFVGDEPDAGAFGSYLADHPGAIDIWLGGHTHAHPDDTRGGRSHIEEKWGVTFINAAALTRYHGRAHSMPMSRLFSFREGAGEVRVRCYLHTSEFAPQGWYGPAERTIRVGRPFRGPSHEDVGEQAFWGPSGSHGRGLQERPSGSLQKEGRRWETYSRG